MLNRAFAPLLGLPCWNVKKGHGSFLTFEFGDPSLAIREPRQILDSDSPKIRQRKRQRLVTVRGDWHLWIYCCDWRIFQADIEICQSASADWAITSALARVNGQKLTTIEIGSSDGTSQFHFDLGGLLKTSPYTISPDSSSGDEKQWMLFTPNHGVFSYDSDGKCAWEKGDEA